ncbi:MAG: fumarylacetoacetate hydrolase family protein [Rhodospirillaceae bacterium]|nr:fumarylacetoacetate hydrolase family protein [Rhodospirillaceae bacterium]
MELLTISVGDRETIAARTDERSAVIDIGSAGIAESMLDLAARPATVLDEIRKLLANPKGALTLRDYSVRAPVPVPKRNIFCVGKNYRAHAAEFGRSGFDAGAVGGDEVPEAPIVFSKPPSSVASPGSPIRVAADPYHSVDYEGELAVVIGRGGSKIAAHAAMDHVFGYTIVNDVTAREVQKRHKQWLLGKGIDGYCPMGPVIVPRSDVEDVGALRLTTTVNGELRQEAYIRDLIFPIPELIATISRFITLQPGDIIATGTPEGVGVGFHPPKYLQPGDVVAITISGIGTLQNPVV